MLVIESVRGYVVVISYLERRLGNRYLFFLTYPITTSAADRSGEFLNPIFSLNILK
jgi:uncharacterized membrane protein YwaF